MNKMTPSEQEDYLKKAGLMSLILKRGIPLHFMNELLTDIINCDYSSDIPTMQGLVSAVRNASAEGCDRIRLRKCSNCGACSISPRVLCDKCLKEKKTITQLIKSCQCETCLANNTFFKWFVKEKKWLDANDIERREIGVQPSKAPDCPEKIASLLAKGPAFYFDAVCNHSRFSSTCEEHLVETFLCMIADLIKNDMTALMTNTTPEELYLQLDYAIKEKWVSCAVGYNRYLSYLKAGMFEHAARLAEYLESIPDEKNLGSYLHEDIQKMMNNGIERDIGLGSCSFILC